MQSRSCASSKGDFKKPTTVLYYSARTEGYKGEPVQGVDKILEMAEQPKGVPAENWLPITREDLALDVIMRVYQPDLKKMQTWKAPKAEILTK